MDYNVLAYAIYALLMIFIIVYVGRYFYTRGRIFIRLLMGGDAALTDSINGALLVGYCLLNCGYAFLQLHSWQTIFSLRELISSLSSHIGVLIVLLAGLHYANMGVIYLLSRKKSDSITIQSPHYE